MLNDFGVELNATPKIASTLPESIWLAVFVAAPFIFKFVLGFAKPTLSSLQLCLSVLNCTLKGSLQCKGMVGKV
jgi:hypothetical protein